MNTLKRITLAVRSFEIGSSADDMHDIVNTNTFLHSSFCDEVDARLYMNTFREFVHAVTCIKDLDEATLRALRTAMLKATHLIKRVAKSDMDSYDGSELRVELNELNKQITNIIEYGVEALDTSSDAHVASCVRNVTKDPSKDVDVDAHVVSNVLANVRTKSVAGAYSKYAFGAHDASIKLQTLHATVLVYLALKSQGRHGWVLKNFKDLINVAGGNADVYSGNKFTMDIRQKYCYMLKVKLGWYKYNTTVIERYAEICAVTLTKDMKQKLCRNAMFENFADTTPYKGPDLPIETYVKHLESLSTDVKHTIRRDKNA